MITTAYVRNLAKRDPKRAYRIASQMVDGYIRAALSKTYTSPAQEADNWLMVTRWNAAARQAKKAARRVN